MPYRLLVDDEGRFLVDDAGRYLYDDTFVEPVSAFATRVPPQIAYRVDVYNHDLERQFVLDIPALKTVSYEVVLNDVGIATFAISANDYRASLIQRDWIFEVLRYNGEDWFAQAAYLVKMSENITDDNNQKFRMFGGLSLEQLLNQRLIDPDDDPLSANGYSTKSGAAETVMHDYVREQIGEDASTTRQVGMVNDTDLGRGLIVGKRARYENLLDTIKGFASVGEVDFRVSLVDGAITFIVENTGTDRSRTANHANFALFAKTRGNVINPRFSRDWRTTANVAYTLGPGQGEDRDVYKLPTPDALATPFSRAETLVDAGQSEAGSGIQATTTGYTRLYEMRPRISFNFELKQLKNSRYQVDWFLGDTVTARDDDGYEIEMRFTRVSVSFEEGRQEVINPTLEALL